MIRLENVSKTFTDSNKEVHAVNNVSLTINDGDIFGIIGFSGAGKSTLVRCINLLEKPTEGAILYRGMDILDWTAKEQKKYRTKIQMIFQDPYSSLNPRKHIYEILAAPMLYHGISDKDVKELLEMVGMPQSALGRYPHEFSGGQRQRIGIARALSLKPEFIVCDEPVSALDVSVQAQILNLLKSLQNELQLTLLFIGHGLGAVHYVSDRIAVMQNGRIVELGDAREVFHHPQQEYTKMLLNSILEPKAYSEDRDS
jgi:ABC-type oligopeptide transport system ATPase subunit